MINDSFPFFTFISSVIFIVLAIYSYRYRRSPGSIPFIAAMLLLTFLGIASIFELISESLQQKILWRNLQQIPLFVCPVLIYILVLQFIGKDKKMILHRSILFGFPVIIYLALIFTDQWHHLMRSEIMLKSQGEFEQIIVESTELSLLFIVYIRVVVIVSLLTLFLNLVKVSELNRKQYYILILGILIPYILTVLPETYFIEINTAVASIPMGIMYFYALFKYKFLQVPVIAKDKILEHIKEGIVVLDQNDIIVELNPSSKYILLQMNQSNEIPLIGESLYSILKDQEELYYFYKEKSESKKEIKIGESYFSVAVISVKFTKQNKGALLIFTDITDRKKYEEYLLERATMDSLTGVYNRQYLQDASVESLNQNKKLGRSVSLLLLDLDKFKAINDTYGHQVGDQVLVRFAQCLKGCVDNLGIVSRVGGEEFAVLLPNMDSEKAYELAELIRKKVEKILIRTEEENKEFTFSVSIGVATSTDPKVTYKMIYNKADQALYLSKNNGRNQTTISSETTPRVS